MNALAKTVVHALAFLELSDDETLDPDAAVQAMEQLASDLQDCTDEERAALKAAVDAEYHVQVARLAPKDSISFYKDLLTNIGLGEEV